MDVMRVRIKLLCPDKDGQFRVDACHTAVWGAMIIFISNAHIHYTHTGRGSLNKVNFALRRSTLTGGRGRGPLHGRTYNTLVIRGVGGSAPLGTLAHWHTRHTAADARLSGSCLARLSGRIHKEYATVNFGALAHLDEVGLVPFAVRGSVRIRTRR